MRMLEHEQDEKSYPLTRTRPRFNGEGDYAAQILAAAPKKSTPKRNRGRPKVNEKNIVKIKACLEKIQPAGTMEISDYLGLSHSTVRSYLSELRGKSVVKAHREGQRTLYTVVE